MIDIFVAIFAVWAFILGLKRGLIVQLCHFVGIYVAILIAPSLAEQVGSLVMDDPGKAYLAGFCIIVMAIVLLVWVVAPMLRAVIVWKPAKALDSVLGGLLNLATMILVTAALFSVFDRVNISEKPRWDKISELVMEGNTTNEQLRDKILSLENGKGEMRDYFYPRLVEYETLDESITFTPLARFGDKVCPSIQTIDALIQQAAAEAVYTNSPIIEWE